MYVICCLSVWTVPPGSCPCKHQIEGGPDPLLATPSAPLQSHVHLQVTDPPVRPPTCKVGGRITYHTLGLLASTIMIGLMVKYKIYSNYFMFEMCSVEP